MSTRAAVIVMPTRICPEAIRAGSSGAAGLMVATSNAGAWPNAAPAASINRNGNFRDILVLRWDLVHRIDHQDIDRLFPRFEFKPAIVLHGREDGRALSV